MGAWIGLNLEEESGSRLGLFSKERACKGLSSRAGAISSARDADTPGPVLKEFKILNDYYISFRQDVFSAK